MSDLRVLSVASEVYPLIKTGGLADVVGALPGALAGEGVEMHTLVPGYPAVMRLMGKAVALALPSVITAMAGGPGRLLVGEAAGLAMMALDIPHLYDRPGNPYLGPDGQDWPDNGLRFGVLARMAAEIGMGCLPAWVPDLVHAHDWQAGLAPAYLTQVEGRSPPSVMTVHNLAFAGKVPMELGEALGLSEVTLSIDGAEFYGDISLLKAGLRYADAITTVSPSYAAEILTPEWGMGLDGLLRSRGSALRGILNGIDTHAWNPAEDALLTARYDAQTLAARAVNKAALQARMGLYADPSAPLFGAISRLSWQKGIDVLLEAIPALLSCGGQLAILGAGDAELEAAVRDASAAHPGRIGCRIGYNEAVAHAVQGGCDALLVPSRFEPCGLTQLYALRYGAIPVVARVGGLADTVIDANAMALSAGVATGVQFAPVSAEALSAAILRTAGLFANKPAWTRMQANGMASDVSWRGPAREYAMLYHGLVAA
jgi:starch synthase